MRRNIRVAEAQEAILERVERLPSQTVAVGDALGRVLSEEVFSTRTLPPADCSAMDGYALSSADTAGADSAAPVDLEVAFEVAAGGQATCELASGQAARIFTGAPIPPGADAVVMQEHVEEQGDAVRISAPVPAGSHVREAGEDLWVGDLVLEAGTEIRPPQVGLLASLGRAVVAVHQRPRVAILSSGDELVEPDREITGGRIVSSNSYTLAALCREAGAEPVYLGIAQDRPEQLEALVRAGLSADCLVSSAGVSVGDHDHVRDVLEKLGCELIFWGIQMKPGHPMTFGRFTRGVGPGAPGPFVFGLPGNPVSAAVTFEQFVRPALRRMAGHRACFRPVVQARLDAELRKKAGRVNFVRVRLERRDGEVWACSTGNQSSGVFRSMSLAQGLLIFGASATQLAAGSLVPVQVIDEGFFAAEARGFEED